MKSKKKVLHYPRLDTVLMVEEFISENSHRFKKRAIWENLPKRVMYQTYCLIIEYLLDTGKISIDEKRRLGLAQERGTEPAQQSREQLFDHPIEIRFDRLVLEL